LRDQDCGAGSICQCGDPVGVCTPTNNCLTDADCAPGKACASASGNTTDYGGCGIRFACQTAVDQCKRRSDCASAAGSSDYCAIGKNGRSCQVTPQDIGCT
jgi:hypothetical protein